MTSAGLATATATRAAVAGRRSRRSARASAAQPPTAAARPTAAAALTTSKPSRPSSVASIAAMCSNPTPKCRREVVHGTSVSGSAMLGLMSTGIGSCWSQSTSVA